MPWKSTLFCPLAWMRPLASCDGGDDRLARRQVAPLVVGVRNVVGGELAGQFAGGVGAHAVGHDEQVAAAAPVACRPRPARRPASPDCWRAACPRR